jgi:transposase
MAGRFHGLTDGQWKILSVLMPKEPGKRTKGKPHTPWRKVCDTIFWLLITGARWADLPIGEKWASRSAAHRWLGLWQIDGTLENILSALRAIAVLEKRIDWDRLAVDGFFFCRQRRR